VLAGWARPSCRRAWPGAAFLRVAGGGYATPALAPRAAVPMGVVPLAAAALLVVPLSRDSGKEAGAAARTRPP